MQIKYKYIFANKWFISNKNIKFFSEVLSKKFIMSLKNNRLIALNLEDKIKGNYVSIKDTDTQVCSNRLIYLLQR